MNDHLSLEIYFRQINKPNTVNKINNSTTVKESTMFDNVKASMQMARNKLSSLWVQQPTTFVDNTAEPEHEDYWSFEMYTGTWVDFEGEGQPVRHTWIQEPHEGTWMGVLDTILEAMNKHYGYNIKEQVYYSVKFPMNGICEYTDEPFDGHGRCLNDEILQQLLLAYPEAYDSHVPNFKLTAKKSKK
jgi:hypothetical protein